jgi:glycosyltransferase involved in cell wall biosynthesis
VYPPSSVIIATANRADVLREAVTSLASQTVPPLEVILVDGSDGEATRQLAEELGPTVPFPLRHLRATRRGAAVQRNQGAELARGDVLFFLDDDVVLEPPFVEEVLRVFAEDQSGRVGGVSGIIVNQTYGTPSRWSRLFSRLMAGQARPSYAGRVIGPALNLLPEDRPGCVQEVEWLYSGATAYRADVFRRHQFGTHFTGYSFAEDLHLSARVAQTHRLVNTTRARLFHKDLGGTTHRDWVAIGRMQAINRWVIMTDVLGRRQRHYRVKFFVALAVLLASDLARSPRQGTVRQTLQRASGQLLGCLRILQGARLT